MDTENKNSKKPASNKKVTRKKVPNKPINKDLLDMLGEENAARISMTSIDDLPKEIQEQIRANLKENDISEEDIEIGIIKGSLDDKDTKTVLFNGVLKDFKSAVVQGIGQLMDECLGDQQSLLHKIANFITIEFSLFNGKCSLAAFTHPNNDFIEASEEEMARVIDPMTGTEKIFVLNTGHNQFISKKMKYAHCIDQTAKGIIEQAVVNYSIRALKSAIKTDLPKEAIWSASEILNNRVMQKRAMTEDLLTTLKDHTDSLYKTLPKHSVDLFASKKEFVKLHRQIFVKYCNTEDKDMEDLYDAWMMFKTNKTEQTYYEARKAHIFKEIDHALNSMIQDELPADE